MGRYRDFPSGLVESIDRSGRCVYHDVHWTWWGTLILEPLTRARARLRNQALRITRGPNLLRILRGLRVQCSHFSGLFSWFGCLSHVESAMQIASEGEV